MVAEVARLWILRHLTPSRAKFWRIRLRLTHAARWLKCYLFCLFFCQLSGCNTAEDNAAPSDAPTNSSADTRDIPSEKPVTIAPSVAEPDVTVSAVQLATDYAADEKAADEKYMGKDLRMEGEVLKAGVDEQGVLFVDLKGIEGLRISCGFPADTKEKVEALKPGDKVTIQGSCGFGKLDDVVSVNMCEFVE